MADLAGIILNTPYTIDTMLVQIEMILDSLPVVTWLDSSRIGLT